MITTLDNTRKSMIYIYQKDGLSITEATEKADEYLQENKDRISYCVTEPDCKLMDVFDGVKIKSPAKYFKNLNHAKIHQLRGILNINIHRSEDIEKMKDELKALELLYPEYSI